MPQATINKLVVTLTDAIELLDSIDGTVENNPNAELLQKMAIQLRNDIEKKIPPIRKSILDINY